MIPFKKAREIRGHRVFAKLQGVTRGYATPAVSIFSDVSAYVSAEKEKVNIDAKRKNTL